ncbi:TolC family protein [Helicobacter sp. MIT 21-1697]|uniref:TolC family protein n=1 Tax=Helicobacter sp. MIT 21-1697 TaxID=2993733 RepID=UPI00224B9A41|nr:TolC family protein [Helicobacter sp. MIT 21-1697]MCX2716655.1 TolC family protein [Helicobacter sp. MIT 21-1697]
MRYLWLFVGMIYMGCGTQIPTLEQSAQQTHIPSAFSNAKDLLIPQNTTKIKQSTDSVNIESLQEQPFRLQQFMALIDDKQLHQILHLALKNNTNVLTMISRIKQAKSQMKINTANMLPILNAGLNSSYIDRRTLSQTATIRPGANSINANISMSWELDLFGKLNALTQSSKKAYLQAQSNLAFAQISLIAEVATLYFTLRDNAYSLTLAKSTLKNLEQIQAINTDKHKLGLIDIHTYQSFVANTTAQKNTYESLSYTFEQNKNALLVLLNINADELAQNIDFLDSLHYTFPHIANFYIDKMPSDILLSRPDIQASLYALHSQLYKQSNANAARLPNISLSGSIGEILYSTNGAGSLVFQIANSITAPLLNRTSLKQNYLIQKELSNEAYYTLQNNVNTALSEVENALFDMQSKKNQVQNTQNVYDIGAKAYESNSAKNKRGLLDKNDFLSNENTYFNLQTQLHNAKTSEILSLITLFKALGGNLALEQIENLQKEKSPLRK